MVAVKPKESKRLNNGAPPHIRENARGELYERFEYAPYGEVWIDWVNTVLANRPDQTPYRFTGKEQDEETGLYYYGARYLDPRTSRWLSADPAMGEYIPAAPVNDEVRKRNQNLPGMGGIFNYVNLHVYHYAGNNPVKYTDPDGEKFEFVEGSTEVFKEDIQKMIDYLGDNETIKALIERPETVYLAENKNNEMYFDRKTNTIYMDTHSGVRPVSDDGIKIMENQIQSPALGFLHESGHALQKILHPIKFFIDLIRRDRNYRNAEERRVIENVETPTARKLGEPIRTNNKGVEVQVPSPTYSENGAM